MLMTEEEIRRDYRLARDPDEQVHILAELNCTTRGVIRRILDGETRDTVRCEAIGGTGCTRTSERRYKLWTDADYARIREMLLRKCPYREIAAALGRDEKAVMNAVARYNKQVCERGGELMPSRRRSKRKSRS